MKTPTKDTRWFYDSRDQKSWHKSPERGHRSASGGRVPPHSGMQQQFVKHAEYRELRLEFQLDGYSVDLDR